MNKSNWLLVVVLLACAFTWFHKGEVAAQAKGERAIGRYQILVSSPGALCFMVDTSTGELWQFSRNDLVFQETGHIPKKSQ